MSSKAAGIETDSEFGISVISCLFLWMNEWMKLKRTEHYLTMGAKDALQIFSLLNKFSRASQLITMLIGAGQTLDKHKGETVLTSLDCTQFSRTYMNTTHFHEVV